MRLFKEDRSKFDSASNEFGQIIEINLIGFCPLNTASGRTNRRSFPETFHDVTQPPNKYSSASLQIIFPIRNSLLEVLPKIPYHNSQTPFLHNGIVEAIL